MSSERFHPYPASSMHQTESDSRLRAQAKNSCELCTDLQDALNQAIALLLVKPLLACSSTRRDTAQFTNKHKSIPHSAASEHQQRQITANAFQNSMALAVGHQALTGEVVGRACSIINDLNVVQVPACLHGHSTLHELMQLNARTGIRLFTYVPPSSSAVEAWLS